MIEPLLAHNGGLHLQDTFDIIGLSASVLFAAVAGYRLALGAVRRRRAELTETVVSRKLVSVPGASAPRVGG